MKVSLFEMLQKKNLNLFHDIFFLDAPVYQIVDYNYAL